MVAKVLTDEEVRNFTQGNISKAYEILEALHEVLSDSDKHLNRVAALEQIEEAQGVLKIAYGDLFKDDEWPNGVQFDNPNWMPRVRRVPGEIIDDAVN